ncbi:MAG TPA: AAA family ATPase [Pseudonocardiaceae bacterium]|nr:AAA family ATPase [Pseudonocardiaceae bacterium]
MRARELAALRAQRHRSTLGELRVALVLGDAGLGKTRLVGELVPCHDEYAVGLIAHSCPFNGMPPFGPWADALGLRVSGPGADRACRVCGSGLGGLPALVGRVDFSHDAAACAGALRYHLAEWIPALLARASAERPIVMFLDDAHRGEPAVWEMLLRLARDYPASRVFVLVTARPAELARNATALAVLHALEQDARVCRVALEPFSRHDIRELTAHALPHGGAPSALVDWVMARTQGNPRLVVGLLEESAVTGTAPHAPDSAAVPERLARWIRTELTQLGPADLALLEVLAVLGDPVDPDDLARIADAPLEDVALALERLAGAGMVAEQQCEGSLGYLLSPALTREVIYAGIGGARKRVMHRRAAAALLDSGRIEVAARHYVCAARTGDSAAIAALIEVARHAQQRGLGSLAWQTVRSLQDLLPVGDQRWCEVFDAVLQGARWGIVNQTEHFVPETTALARMRQLLPGVRDPQRQAEVRLWLAGLFAYGAGDMDAGTRECQQALALCQQAGREVTARLAAIELAKLQGCAGDLRGEETAARALLSEAEQAGDQRGIAEALVALGHALGWQGRFDAAESVLSRGLEMADEAAHSSWMSQSLTLLACLDACRGHLVSARARWAHAAAIRAHDDPAIARWGEFIELLAGDLTTALGYALRAQRHEPAGFCLPLRLAGRAALAAAERGALAEACRNLRPLARVGSGALGLLEPLYWWAEAAVARAEGQLATAASALRRAVEGYSEMGARALLGYVLADLAEVSALADDWGAVTEAARCAQDNARATGAPLHLAIQTQTSAWALIGRGQRDAAARAALSAAEEFGSRGYELMAARAQVAYAHAVRRCDRGAARDAVRAATATFEACGALVRQQQAQSLLEQLGAGGPGTAPGTDNPGELTLRERQVAELAAAGYTAAQIATRLHIGVRTVETHLARSYRKLGVSRKQQLVHRATELGLTLGLTQGP